MSYYWSAGILVAFAVVCCIIVFFPAKRSTGGKSSSLSLLRAVVAFTLLIVLIDTVNDAYITFLQTQVLSKRPGIAEQVIRKVVLGDYKKQTKPDTGEQKTKDTNTEVSSGMTPAVTSKRQPRGASPSQAAPARANTGRNVSDRKYELLGYLCFLAFFLYILSKPDTWEFVIRFFESLFLSWRGVARDTKHKEEITVNEPPSGLSPPTNPGDHH